jgi:hypothetical protein
LTENWQLVAEIVVSVAAAILSGGTTLVSQALIQASIALAFSIDDLAKGDYWTAGIALAISSVPIVGRLAKFGVNAPSKFLAKHSSKLAGLKDSPVAMKAFFEGLDEGEKLLFTRALKQTRGEMIKNVSTSLVAGLDKSVKNGVVQLSKIPLKQKLWWKEVFVEGGIALNVGLGLSLMKSIEESEKFEEDISKSKITKTEKSQQYATTSKKIKTEDPKKYQATTDSTVNYLGGEDVDPRDSDW